MKASRFIILGLVVLGFVLLYYFEPIGYCTQEARMCPDGSYVGRVGLQCQFAACPNDLNNKNATITASHHSIGRMRLANLIIFVLSFTIFTAIPFSLCLCSCVAIARRRRCAQNNECDLESLQTLTEHVETQPEPTTVVPQVQPQPIYYYAPYPQAPVVNQAPYGVYPSMMPVQAPMVSQHVVFQPMSDEDYASHLQSQFNNEH